jgi:hypothetical protein
MVEVGAYDTDSVSPLQLMNLEAAVINLGNVHANVPAAHGS